MRGGKYAASIDYCPGAIPIIKSLGKAKAAGDPGSDKVWQ
jgi:hypothetical protein